MPAIGPSMVEMFVRSDEEAGKEKVTATPDAELSRRRELNALREQLNNAVKAEEYERAAELRDQIRELEKKKD
jgi:protein-arginine kinase activator protein McsA